ncbi:S-4TM family putative pore-forming effector [Paraburkholderia sediminicola]|uniref:S-4TM family putative pore-forming effector n=1 Tax=Paraburkholderia sediminicola TaxID=458836 RepID=UPI0038BB1A18
MLCCNIELATALGSSDASGGGRAHRRNGEIKVTISSIATRQNEPHVLELQWARRVLYGSVKRFQGLLVALTILMPVLSAIIAEYWPARKAWVALAALVIGCLDAAFLDRWIKKRMKEGARLQEEFDCYAFNLPWNRFLAGAKVDHEDVARLTKTRVSDEVEASFLDWYAPSVAEIPLHAGRVACQRSNLWFDLRLRSSYITFICFSLGILVVAALALAIWQDRQFASVILTGAVPLTPFVLWALRERNRQSDAVALVERLKAQAEKLWDEIIGGASEESLAELSRELQDAIFSHRASSPLIFDWFYTASRTQLESDMVQGAEYWVKNFKAAKRVEA